MAIKYPIVDSKSGGNDQLNQDWQEMIQRFQVLSQTFPYNADINDYVRVLKKNHPTKSLWRKYWKCMIELEEQAKQINLANRK